MQPAPPPLAEAPLPAVLASESDQVKIKAEGAPSAHLAPPAPPAAEPLAQPELSPEQTDTPGHVGSLQASVFALNHPSFVVHPAAALEPGIAIAIEPSIELTIQQAASLVLKPDFALQDAASPPAVEPAEFARRFALERLRILSLQAAKIAADMGLPDTARLLAYNLMHKHYPSDLRLLLGVADSDPLSFLQFAAMPF